jgi:preprotein translocase subunit YajC
MVEMTQFYPIVAMAQPAQGGGNALVQFFPIVLMLGIFYFLVLMPMRKRQKKVQEFQSALKVGDRVITTSGIHGQVVRITDDTVRLQIADKVNIDIARASIGGFQGQAPVVQQEGQ